MRWDYVSVHRPGESRRVTIDESLLRSPYWDRQSDAEFALVTPNPVGQRFPLIGWD